MFDFSQYAEFQNVDATVAAAGEGTGSGKLPAMNQCVLVITGLNQRFNDHGFKGVSFEFQVVDGGSAPQNKGLQCNHLFTIENPNSEKNAQIGREDIARIVKAVGMQALGADGAALIGKQFMCNVVHSPKANDPSDPYINLKMIKPVGMTSAPAQPANNMAQKQQQFGQQPTGFAPQQPTAASPFNQGQQQQAPQQGGMPEFLQPR